MKFEDRSTQAPIHLFHFSQDIMTERKKEEVKDIRKHMKKREEKRWQER